jgi:PAS domain S-box-containing protein
MFGRLRSVIARQFSDRIAPERVPRSSAERFEALAHLAPAAIFRADPSGNIVFVNDRACAITGLTRAEFIALGWVRAIHPGDRGTALEVWQRYVASGGVVACTPECRVVKPDGSVAWVLAHIEPERDDQGHLTWHVGTLMDISAVKLAQLELQQAHDGMEVRVRQRTHELESAKELAERSDRVKTAFLTTMSHELRTPLNSIVGFTTVILQGQSGPLTDAQSRQLTIVHDSASHLRALIENVLDITRIEAGQVGIEITSVDLHELVSRHLSVIAAEASRKHIRLDVVAADGVPAIRTDAKRAGQIFGNLLANAVKFTEQGSVTVEIAARMDRIEITVSDTGIGIAEHELSSLFNPFSQVSRPGGRLHEGTGLGLAISRNLARALGGDIAVTSEEGRGSRFALWLPHVAAEPVAVPVAAPVAARTLPRFGTATQNA